MTNNLEILTTTERYWLALGRFTSEYSRVETCVQTLLWIVAETPPKTAQAIFSGTKTDTACRFIRRLFESRNEDLPELLSRAFDRLAIINTVRNDIIHYGIQYDEASRMVTSNAMMALPGKERKTHISPLVLEQLWGDLVTIQYCMNAYFFSTKGGSKPSVIERSLKGAQVPWQYKPPSRQEARKDEPRKSRSHSRMQ